MRSRSRRPRATKTREQEARARIADLEKRLARLEISVPAGSAPSGLVIRVDDVRIEAPGRTTVPVDSGVHAVGATAEGRRPWTINVTVKEARTETVTLPVLEAVGVGVIKPPPPLEPPAPRWRTVLGGAVAPDTALLVASGAF
jgi:hypothetical protein